MSIEHDPAVCPCCGARPWWLDPDNVLVRQQTWDRFAALLVNAAARDHAEAQLARQRPITGSMET